MFTIAEFEKTFSIPREPRTALAPGQYHELTVHKGKKVLITDVYIENLGNDVSLLSIEEQRVPNSFEVRYTFRTEAHQVTVVNFTTGLKLGDEAPISGSIRFFNDMSSQADIVVRVNGVLVD